MWEHDLGTIRFMKTRYFYKDLPYVEALLDINNDKYFKDVPLDWSVVITDIVNSTHEVESGRFKEVNLITAATITAILNIDKHNDIPFVYGGDGAVLLVPPYIADVVPSILKDVQIFAKDHFDLTLRAGIVPVIDVVRNRNLIRICKVKITDSYFQPIFHGKGIEHAEYLVRNSKQYNVENLDIHVSKANFEGLQCVWQTVPSKDEEVLSILIKPDEQANIDAKVYRKVLQKIEDVYGPKQQRMPVQDEHVRLRFNIDRIKLSSYIHSHQKNWKYPVSYSYLYVQDMIKWFSKRLRYELKHLDSVRFKQVVNKALESEKVDNMLKMVLAGTNTQRLELEAFLKTLYSSGELFYGLHVSDSVYMTCFLFEKNGNKVQFIDGSNGGYTIASKELKNRMKWGQVGLVV